MILSQIALNPYYYGSPIRDAEGFYGRQRQLQDTCELIYKKECVNIIGERRSGKTSFLFHMLEPQVRQEYGLDDPNAIYLYVDAEVCPQDSQGFFAHVFHRVKTLYPDLPISPDENAIDEPTVTALLKAIRPHRLVLLIDEFERISLCPAFPPRFFVFLRGLSIVYDVSFVIATCRRLVECCTEEVISSPFPNVFCAVETGPFTAQELDYFLEQTSTKGGLPMTRLRDRIFRLAGSLPYLVQMACWHYFRAWSESGEVTDEAHDLVRNRFADDARPFFAAAWDRYLGEQDREALQALASGQQARADTIWSLSRRGYVVDSGVASELFAQYILARTEVPQPRAVEPVIAQPNGLYVDTESGNVYLNGTVIDPPLPKYQYRLLKLLYENRGRICSPYMIVEAVWSEEYIDQVEDQRIAQLIRRLRKLIELEGKPWRYILTVRGRGLTLGDGDSKPARPPVEIDST